MDLAAVQVKQFNADVIKTIEKFVQASSLKIIMFVFNDKKYVHFALFFNFVMFP